MAQAKIQPFLWYAKDAEQAAKFYASIFPDSRVKRVTALQSESPSGPPGSVKFVDFTLFGQPFTAMEAGPHHDFNDAISIMVTCDDQAELDKYWNALLQHGGQPTACGWLNDRYGVRWQIVPARLMEMMADKDTARSKRASDAMMQMVKLDIAALEKAYRGGWATRPRARRSMRFGGSNPRGSSAAWCAWSATWGWRRTWRRKR